MEAGPPSSEKWGQTGQTPFRALADIGHVPCCAPAMRRASGKLLRPIATPFAVGTDFALRSGKGILSLAQRAAERLGGAKVAVIPTADAPPTKATRRRKTKRKRSAKR